MRKQNPFRYPTPEPYHAVRQKLVGGDYVQKMWKRCGPVNRIIRICQRLFLASMLTGTLLATEEQAHAANRPAQHKQVLVIGGSMAYGYRDPDNHSYIQRAFEKLAAEQHTTLTCINHAKPGGTSVALAKRGDTYARWLKEVHPDTVAVSWGLENDCKHKTPLSAFEQTLRQEIQSALNAHANVVVIAPPVTEANSTYFQAATNRYLAAEQQVASSFAHQPVYFCDVLNQMRVKLAKQGASVQTYKGDSWHPNTVGHQLAGDLLYAELLKIPLWHADQP